MRSPAKLWDHCLELKAYVCSNTALSIYSMEGQVPETMILGHTANISPFAKVGWFKWVYWWFVNSAYLEQKEVLGMWLGPAVDVDPAMRVTILKFIGQIAYLSSYRALNALQLQDKDCQKESD